MVKQRVWLTTLSYTVFLFYFYSHYFESYYNHPYILVRQIFFHNFFSDSRVKSANNLYTSYYNFTRMTRSGYYRKSLSSRLLKLFFFNLSHIKICWPPVTLNQDIQVACMRNLRPAFYAGNHFATFIEDHEF